MTRWGQRAARGYLIVAGLALVAMLVETLLGHPGTGTMFAATLAAPWSMLAASFLPPLPRDWPMAAGLVVRMAPLALFMLLNAAIVAGIAARSERDVRGVASKLPLVLLVLAATLSSGCILTSRQVVMVAEPVGVTQYFNVGVRALVYEFNLANSAAWRDHRGELSGVTDLTILGGFSYPPGTAFPGPTLNVTIITSEDPIPKSVLEPAGWGPVRLDTGQSHRVEWSEGQRLFTSDPRTLRRQVTGDGRFSLVVQSYWSAPNLGGVEVSDFHLGAVLHTK